MRSPAQDLMFLHIGRNAGTSIENVGKINGVNWGRFDTRLFGQAPERMSNKQSLVSGVPNWFCPLSATCPRLIPNTVEVSNNLFCVVRHPFERVVSMYKCPQIKDFARRFRTVNDFVPALVGELEKNEFAFEGRCVAQWKYVYLTEADARNGKAFTKHVLRHEQLAQDFKNLIASRTSASHPSFFTLDRKDNVSVGRNANEAATSSLNAQSKQIVKRFFAKDFQYLHFSD